MLAFNGVLTYDFAFMQAANRCLFAFKGINL